MKPYLLALIATLGVVILGLLWMVLADVTTPAGTVPSPTPQAPPVTRNV